MMTKNGGAFRSQRGFTLVELMIVVIIIGILTAVGVALYMGYVRDAKAASAQATIGTIVNAEKVYHQLHETFLDVADLSVVPNNLNIDVRDASQYWTIVVSGADASKFTVTATGKAGTDYANIVVTLNYDMAGDEVWTKTENGTAF
jgi:prepilin-type N-terminal cleavage/methylation domain-containing protein